MSIFFSYTAISATTPSAEGNTATPRKPLSITRIAAHLLLLGILSLLANTTSAAINVTLEGVDGDMERNVRAYLSILSGADTTHSPARVHFLHRRAETEIRRALEPFGYYRVAIESSLTQTEEAWTAHYRITPGVRTTLTDVVVEIRGGGHLDPAFRALSLEPGIRVGDGLLHSRYNQLKQRLQNLAAERGYYDARWQEQQILVDRQRNSARIVLRYDTGQRYHYGELIFSETPLRADFIRRFIRIRTGQPLLNSDLLKLQSRLNNSDYFQRVEVRPLWERRQNQQVPVEVILEMRKRSRYRTGVGYDTDTRARLTAGMTRRWVNDSGHGFDTQLQLSPVRTDAVMQYRIPGQQPDSEQYSLRSAYQRENSDPVDSTTLAVGLSLQQRLGQWIQVLGVDWEQEKFTIAGEQQRTRFLFPRISWSRTEASNRLDVRQGYRLNLELLGASDIWYSDTSFSQGRLELKGIYSIGDNWRLIGRSELGGTLIDDADALPASKRFFAGGDNSVRGYSYKSLAPGSISGIEGGQGLLTASAEVDYRVLPAWRAALFVDHGAAVSSLQDDLSTGAGVGVRWLSPVGPVRVDLAWALDLDGSPWRVHFSIGPDL